MPTSKDVAQKANVSIATVSRVFKSPDLVKPATRQLVLDAARELKYYPNIFARNLKEQRSNSIGISVGDFINPFFFQVFEQFNDCIDKTNLQMLVFPPLKSSLCTSKMANYLNSNLLDAFLFSPSFYSEEDHQLLRRTKQYYLQLYTDCYPDIDTVSIDDTYGTYLAVRHLLEYGHRRILMITTEEHCSTRMPGMQQAYHEFGVALDPAYAHYISGENEQRGHIRQLIQMLRPTAIISHTEFLTIQVISALSELNLTWPDDISLMTYDDHPWATVMGITAIAQPIPLVADTIASTVLEALDTDRISSGVKKKIKPELIIRRSTKPYCENV